MKDTRKMTDAEVIKWLDKTRLTIGNYLSRSRSARLGTPRADELVAQYDALREEANGRDSVWETYCTERGYSTAHHGYHVFG